MSNSVDVTLVLNNYAAFLENSYNNLFFLNNPDDPHNEELINNLDKGGIRDDFLQANWEILVEMLICIPGEEFLEPYGNGADCNGDSSRVSLPDKITTHRIQCYTDSNKVMDLLTNKEILLSKKLFKVS